jgi:Domain of unknown function (DUF4157)
MAEDAGEPFDDYWVYNVQRQERGGRGILPWAPAAVRRAAAEDGEPLPWGLRRRYETALGTELDGVRLHTGPAAAAAADALDARAYTIGRHIHFGNSEFAPGTSCRRTLNRNGAPRRPPGGRWVNAAVRSRCCRRPYRKPRKPESN